MHDLSHGFGDFQQLQLLFMLVRAHKWNAEQTLKVSLSLLRNLDITAQFSLPGIENQTSSIARAFLLVQT